VKNFLPHLVKIGLVVALASVFFLQLHNARTYPPRRGFDAVAHLDYIHFLRENHQLPLPISGWEMHQPPLYYALFSLVPTEVTFNIVGFLSWLILVASVAFFVKHLVEKTPLPFKENLDYLVASTTGFAVSVPVVIYLSTAVGNEFFATTLISVCLVYYVTFFQAHLKAKKPSKIPFILGILLGIALLSKVTSLVLVISILCERLIVTNGNLKTVVRQLWVPLGTSVLISGWFYLRNYMLYGNPIFQAADYIPLRNYAQPIVARNLNFLLSPMAFFTKDFFIAQHSSLLAGTYFSWFYDGHGAMLPAQPYTKVGTLLILMSLPFFAVSVWGFVRNLWAMWRQKTYFKNTYLLLFIYTFLLLGAYLHYNFKLPIYSTVKGSFISSLLVPFVYFLYEGFKLVCQKTPKQLRPALYYSFIILTLFYMGLITRHFWVELWFYPSP
jgi:hypothetical protein